MTSRPPQPPQPPPQPDDAEQLSALARQLAMPDLDADRASRIAWSARQDVGRGLSPWRFVEPVVAAALVTSYFIWALLRVYAAWR
jgi:hypothetical protein